MPTKVRRTKRTEVERVRLRNRERKLREPVGKLISEAEIFRMNFETVVRDLSPNIARDRYGNISFTKKLNTKQLGKIENTAKTFLEKYKTLREGHASYKKTARTAKVTPEAFGQQLTVTREGRALGQGIILASIEANRILKAVEKQKEKS